MTSRAHLCALERVPTPALISVAHEKLYCGIQWMEPNSQLPEETDNRGGCTHFQTASHLSVMTLQLQMQLCLSQFISHFCRLLVVRKRGWQVKICFMGSFFFACYFQCYILTFDSPYKTYTETLVECSQ